MVIHLTLRPLCLPHHSGLKSQTMSENNPFFKFYLFVFGVFCFALFCFVFLVSYFIIATKPRSSDYRGCRENYNIQSWERLDNPGQAACILWPE